MPPISDRDRDRSTRASGIRRGVRAVNACSRCRRHKIKCSGTQPCETCTRRRHACTFNDKQRFSQQYVLELQQRVAAAEQKQIRTATQVIASVVSPTSQEDITIPEARHILDSRPVSPAPSIEQIANSCPSIDVPPQRHSQERSDYIGDRDAQLINNLSIGQSLYMPDAGGNPIYLGTSSNWSFGRRVLLVSQKRIASEPLSPQQLSWEGRTYDLDWDGYRSFACAPDRGDAVIPQADFGMYLINAVKFYVGQLYHLFDEVSFMRRFSEFYDHFPCDVSSSVTKSLWYKHYLLILAFGKAFVAREKADDNHPPGRTFFLQAMKTLPDFTIANHEVMESMEILCCAALYLHSLDFRAAAYRLIGHALRTALEHGLHTDMDDQYITAENVERARKIWWTVLLLDRQMSSLMGVPLAIRDEEISARLPSFSGYDSRVLALDIHIKLSSALAKIVTNVYGKEGRINKRFLVHAKEGIKSVAQVTDRLNTSFRLPATPTSFGISRVSAYLHLLYHQCLVLATRPILFNFFEARLRGEHNRSRFSKPSENVNKLLQMCKNSSMQMLRILSALSGQGLLESFLPFDLDATYTSAIVLQMSSHIDPCSRDHDKPWVQKAYSFMNEMSEKGNKIAKALRIEVERLEAILAQHMREEERSSQASEERLDPALNIDQQGHGLDQDGEDSSAAGVAKASVDGRALDWFELEDIWNHGLTPGQMTSVADSINLDALEWWMHVDSSVDLTRDS